MLAWPLMEQKVHAVDSQDMYVLTPVLYCLKTLTYIIPQQRGVK